MASGCGGHQAWKRKSELDENDSDSSNGDNDHLECKSFSSPLNSALIDTSSKEDSNDTYESASSPGNSSTCSGPILRRHSTFVPDTNKEVLKEETSLVKDHKKNAKVQNKNGAKPKAEVSRSQPSPLSRHFVSPLSNVKGVKKKKWPAEPQLTLNAKSRNNKREPLPMKQRALPQSFWQQPNVPGQQPPGNMSLPPLPADDELTPIEDVGANNNSSNNGGNVSSKTVLEVEPIGGCSERHVSVADTDLLFSLFNAVEEDETQKRIQVVRRGRPKKSSVPVLSTSRLPRDENPCLNATVMESILPLIPDKSDNNGDKGAKKNALATGTQVIKILSISDGESTVELPSLNVEHNYPHLLSELVMKL